MAHHEPFKALGAVDWEAVSEDGFHSFLTETFSHAQTIVDSIPVPNAVAAATKKGRSRSHTDSAIPVSEINRSLSQRQSGEAISHAKDLLKEWKEVKTTAKENPLGINVYKLASKDGKGSWFARRSVHEGPTFEKWKLGLEKEFAETMKVQNGPGGGSVRGIGAERRVEHRAVPETGKLEVYQLSAQFPGPTAPRDFVTLLLTSDAAGEGATLDNQQPLRQFMVISRPCQHSECPPRQGYVRGHYESIEIIREVPSDKPAIRRARSSIDLGNDSAEAQALAEEVGREAILRAAKKAAGIDGLRQRGVSASSAPVEDETGRARDGRHEDSEETSAAVEWLMVTRSDPGGSVPRFMVEKGTPGGIVSDAAKFLNWITAKRAEEFAPSEDNDFKTEAIKAEEENAKPQIVVRKPTANLVPDGSTEQTESIPSSNGLYGIITGAFEAASSVVATRLPYPFTGSGGESIPEDDEDDSTLTDTSSVHSFTSALENNENGDVDGETKGEDIVSMHSTQSTHSDESTLKPSTPNSQQEKELRKLQERRRKLEGKVAKMQERMSSKRSDDKDKEKDAVALAKLREKHEREMARQEERYHRELKKLEEKREQEERKAKERRRKAQEREERANIAMELEKVKAERDLALTQLEILKGQVGELQTQNTMLVAQLGRLGVKREDSGWSATTKRPEPVPAIVS